MQGEIFSIIIIVALIITKIIKDYMLENGIWKNKVKDSGDKIDNFINKHYKKILFIFLILILISRIYKFGEIPDYIGVDEAGAAYDAYCLANYGVDRYLNSYPVYLINFGGGQSALYAYISALLIKIIGANIIAYRLPSLLFYLISIIVCYILANKFTDKKTSLLFTFLIIICTWHIGTSRLGLDCDLLAPMFIIDVFLLLNSRKNWHYIVSGIFIGLTLYTYAISYLLIPMFIITYIGYMTYLKKIDIKQVILLGIPIFILALPLIYMILLNKGYFTRTTFGIFTIPILPQFRAGEISITNIWEYGLSSLANIFISGNVIYLSQVPLFIIGLVKGITDLKNSIKQRKFNLNAFMTLIFIVLLITNLLVEVQTINKANILYLPMLYLIAIGIINLCEKSPIILVTIIAIFIILFINFEIHYYNGEERAKECEPNMFVDKQIYSITQYIENKYDCNNAQVCFIVSNKVQPYIYTLMQKKISPYEFYETVIFSEPKEKIEMVCSYSNYHFIKNVEQLEAIDNSKDTIYIIDNRGTKIIENLIKQGFTKETKGSYEILVNF